MIYLFWIFLFFIVMAYFLYPVIIWILARIFKKTFKYNYDFKPAVSIIISAYNEEVVLAKTLKNFLSINYPEDKIEIIVGSDCSIDRTNEIIKEFENKYPNIVRGIIFNNRRGKACVLNDLVKLAKNDIIIFADANTMYEKDAISEMVKYYIDDRIGGVCGKLVLVDNKSSIESGNKEKMYWDIETWIKMNEGNLGVLIGANGGIYSIRRELYQPIPENKALTDDLFIGLQILKAKRYFIYSSEAKAYEDASPDIKSEYKRKVRMNSTNIITLLYFLNLLSPTRCLVPFSLFFHKILRWFSPILLLILFITNFYLLHLGYFYKIIFTLQIIFYLMSLIGWLLNKLRINLFIFNIPYYFALTNIAFLHGILKTLAKRNTGYWQSTKRV